MIQLQDIGRFETLPDRAIQVVEGHVPALGEAIAQGWDIEEELRLASTRRFVPCISRSSQSTSGRQAPYRTRSQPE